MTEHAVPIVCPARLRRPLTFEYDLGRGPCEDQPTETSAISQCASDTKSHITFGQCHNPQYGGKGGFVKTDKALLSNDHEPYLVKFNHSYYTAPSNFLTSSLQKSICRSCYCIAMHIATNCYQHYYDFTKMWLMCNCKYFHFLPLH